MKKSDISIIIGISIGFGSLIIAFIMEEGNPVTLIGPSALLMIIGGTSAAVIASFGLGGLAKIPMLFKRAMTSPPNNSIALIELFTSLSEKARREGILSLEAEIEQGLGDKMYDPLIERGLRMVVDGIDTTSIEKIFETEIFQFEERRKADYEILEGAGGYSPTMGIIGTVLGLISVLGNLAEPEKLGGSIAVAFIATLYGIGFANLIWLPVGKKLKGIMKGEVEEKELILQGVISIQAGENPRIVKEKLLGFVSEDKREKLRDVEGEG